MAEVPVDKSCSRTPKPRAKFSQLVEANRNKRRKMSPQSSVSERGRPELSERDRVISVSAKSDRVTRRSSKTSGVTSHSLKSREVSPQSTPRRTVSSQPPGRERVTRRSCENAGVTLRSSNSAGVTPQDSKSTGVTPRKSKSTRVTPRKPKSLGVTPQQSKSGGGTPQDSQSTGVTPQPSKSIEETPHVLKSAGETPRLLKSAGETPQVLKSAGETPRVLKSAGETPRVSNSAGVTPQSSKVLIPSKAVSESLETEKRNSQSLTNRAIEDNDQSSDVTNSRNLHGVDLGDIPNNAELSGTSKPMVKLGHDELDCSPVYSVNTMSLRGKSIAKVKSLPGEAKEVKGRIRNTGPRTGVVEDEIAEVSDPQQKSGVDTDLANKAKNSDQLAPESRKYPKRVMTALGKSPGLTEDAASADESPEGHSSGLPNLGIMEMNTSVGTSETVGSKGARGRKRKAVENVNRLTRSSALSTRMSRRGNEAKKLGNESLTKRFFKTSRKLGAIVNNDESFGCVTRQNMTGKAKKFASNDAEIVAKTRRKSRRRNDDATVSEQSEVGAREDNTESESSSGILNIFENFVQSHGVQYGRSMIGQTVDAGRSLLSGQTDFESAYLGALKKILKASEMVPSSATDDGGEDNAGERLNGPDEISEPIAGVNKSDRVEPVPGPSRESTENSRNIRKPLRKRRKISLDVDSVYQSESDPAGGHLQAASGYLEDTEAGVHVSSETKRPLATCWKGNVKIKFSRYRRKSRQNWWTRRKMPKNVKDHSKSKPANRIKLKSKSAHQVAKSNLVPKSRSGSVSNSEVDFMERPERAFSGKADRMDDSEIRLATERKAGKRAVKRSVRLEDYYDPFLVKARYPPAVVLDKINGNDQNDNDLSQAAAGAESVSDSQWISSLVDGIIDRSFKIGRANEDESSSRYLVVSLRDLDDCNFRKKKGVQKKDQNPNKTYFKRNPYRHHQCAFCNKLFANDEILSKHSEIHDEIVRTEIITCSKCIWTFNTDYGYDQHVDFHSGKKPFLCNLCGFAFSEKKCLDMHKSRHNIFSKCSICAQAYKLTYDLSRHISFHNENTRELVYRCASCKDGFANAIALFNHIFSSETCMALAFTSCPKCDFKDIDRQGLIEHLENCEEPILHCALCERSFHSSEEYVNHSETHRKGPYQCVLCSERFKTPQLIMMHMAGQLHKDQGQVHVCDCCGQIFATSMALKRHFVFNHRVSPGSLLQCGNCLTLFSSGQRMVEHFAQVHSLVVSSGLKLRANLGDLLQRGNSREFFSSKERILEQFNKARRLTASSAVGDSAAVTSVSDCPLSPNKSAANISAIASSKNTASNHSDSDVIAGHSETDTAMRFLNYPDISQVGCNVEIGDEVSTTSSWTSSESMMTSDVAGDDFTEVNRPDGLIASEGKRLVFAEKLGLVVGTDDLDQPETEVTNLYEESNMSTRIEQPFIIFPIDKVFSDHPYALNFGYPNPLKHVAGSSPRKSLESGKPVHRQARASCDQVGVDNTIKLTGDATNSVELTGDSIDTSERLMPVGAVETNEPNGQSGQSSQLINNATASFEPDSPSTYTMEVELVDDSYCSSALTLGSNSTFKLTCGSLEPMHGSGESTRTIPQFVMKDGVLYMSVGRYSIETDEEPSPSSSVTPAMVKQSLPSSSVATPMVKQYQPSSSVATPMVKQYQPTSSVATAMVKQNQPVTSVTPSVLDTTVSSSWFSHPLKSQNCANIEPKKFSPWSSRQKPIPARNETPGHFLPGVSSPSPENHPLDSAPGPSVSKQSYPALRQRLLESESVVKQSTSELRHRPLRPQVEPFVSSEENPSMMKSIIPSQLIDFINEVKNAGLVEPKSSANHQKLSANLLSKKPADDVSETMKKLSTNFKLQPSLAPTVSDLPTWSTPNQHRPSSSECDRNYVKSLEKMTNRRRGGYLVCSSGLWHRESIYPGVVAPRIPGYSASSITAQEFDAINNGNETDSEFAFQNLSEDQSELGIGQPDPYENEELILEFEVAESDDVVESPHDATDDKNEAVGIGMTSGEYAQKEKSLPVRDSQRDLSGNSASGSGSSLDALKANSKAKSNVHCRDIYREEWGSDCSSVNRHVPGGVMSAERYNDNDDVSVSSDADTVSVISFSADDRTEKDSQDSASAKPENKFVHFLERAKQKLKTVSLPSKNLCEYVITGTSNDADSVASERDPILKRMKKIMDSEATENAEDFIVSSESTGWMHSSAELQAKDSSSRRACSPVMPDLSPVKLHSYVSDNYAAGPSASSEPPHISPVKQAQAGTSFISQKSSKLVAGTKMLLKGKNILGEWEKETSTLVHPRPKTRTDVDIQTLIDMADVFMYLPCDNRPSSRWSEMIAQDDVHSSSESKIRFDPLHLVYHCTQCPYTSLQYGYVCKHFYYSHMTQKILPCSYCKRSFSLASLSMHSRHEKLCSKNPLNRRPSAEIGMNEDSVKFHGSSQASVAVPACEDKVSPPADNQRQTGTNPGKRSRFLKRKLALTSTSGPKSSKKVRVKQESGSFDSKQESAGSGWNAEWIKHPYESIIEMGDAFYCKRCSLNLDPLEVENHVVTCRICGAKVSKCAHIVVHEARKHANDHRSNVFQCGICMKYFNSYSKLSGHRSGHNQCFFCRDKFLHDGEKKRHFEMCPICDDHVPVCIGLEEHLQVYHESIQDATHRHRASVFNTYKRRKTVKKGAWYSKSVTTRSEHEEQSSKCDCCGREFDSAEVLITHKRSNHFECEICHTFFSEEDTMLEHFDGHFRCPNCTMAFVTQSELNNHVVNCR